MKLNPQSKNLNLTQPQISKHEVVHHSETTRSDVYVHPWYKFNSVEQLKKPNPPTKEAIKKAQFIDKTYQWKKGR